jgi:hypothetical protein
MEGVWVRTRVRTRARLPEPPQVINKNIQTKYQVIFKTIL